MTRVRLFGAFAFACLGFTGSAAWGAAAVDKPAPAFTLPAAAGGTRSLEEAKGKFVVLEWLNHGCPFVRKHYDSGNMQQLQQKYTGQGVVWYSIISSAAGKQGYVTAEGAAKQAAENKSAATAVLLDPDGKVGKLYGAKTTPHMYVIDPTGRLIYQGAIDNRPTTDKADVQGATNHVAAALDAAMAGQPVARKATKAYGCSVKYP